MRTDNQEFQTKVRFNTGNRKFNQITTIAVIIAL